VGAAVEEVLPLEVDVGAVAVAEVAGVVNRRRPAGEALQKVTQVRLERRRRRWDTTPTCCGPKPLVPARQSAET
jgi:hypothetical protein